MLRLVFGEGARTTLFGTAVGILGALQLSRALDSQLYEVEALDPLSYGLVALLVLLVALLATLIPARRAGGVRQDALLRDSYWRHRRPVKAKRTMYSTSRSSRITPTKPFSVSTCGITLSGS
ncbi:MAG: FtsX-like permease family protein [Gemmatimonadota bacterium]